MTSSLRRAIQFMFLGLYAVSMRVGAEVVEASHSSSTAPVKDAPGPAVEFSILQWGLLIGLVLLALAVVARSGRRPH